MREKIDSATWKRRAHCALFGRLDVPFYSVTFRLDVTNLYAWCKREGLPFYHSLIWVTMRAVNRTDAYLYELEGDDVYRLAYRSPSYTYVYDDDLFGICNLAWDADESAAAFCARCKRAEATNTTPLPDAETDAEGHDVYISCLPWFDYTHVAQEFSLDRDDSTPRILWGKFVDENGRKTLAYTVQVNHRLLDGVHLNQLLTALNQEISQLR